MHNAMCTSLCTNVYCTNLCSRRQGDVGKVKLNDQSFTHIRLLSDVKITLLRINDEKHVKCAEHKNCELHDKLEMKGIEHI